MDPEKILTFSVALKHRETQLENANKPTWQSVFPEKERRRINLQQQTSVENRTFEQKAPNAEKQSTGEQVKTRMGAETFLSFICPIKTPKPSSKSWKTKHRREAPTANPLSPGNVSILYIFEYFCGQNPLRQVSQK